MIPGYARLLFGIIEPLANLLGFLGAHASTAGFGRALHPARKEADSHLVRLYGTVLLPLSGTLYALFLPSSHDEALKPVRDTALLFLLIGDFFHVGNYLMPVLRGEMAIGGIDVGGFLGNVGFTLVLAGARVAWFMGH